MFSKKVWSRQHVTMEYFFQKIMKNYQYFKIFKQYVNKTAFELLT